MQTQTNMDAIAGRVRRMYDDGASIYELTREFGISLPQVHRILDGRAYPAPRGPLLPSGRQRFDFERRLPDESELEFGIRRNDAACQRESAFRWKHPLP